MAKIDLLTPSQIKKGMLITAWYNCGVNCHGPLKVIKKIGESVFKGWKEIVCIDLWDPEIPLRGVYDTEFYFFSKFEEAHRNKKVSPAEAKKLSRLAARMFSQK